MDQAINEPTEQHPPIKPVPDQEPKRLEKFESWTDRERALLDVIRRNPANLAPNGHPDFKGKVLQNNPTEYRDLSRTRSLEQIRSMHYYLKMKAERPDKYKEVLERGAERMRARRITNHSPKAEARRAYQARWRQEKANRLNKTKQSNHAETDERVETINLPTISHCPFCGHDLVAILAASTIKE